MITVVDYYSRPWQSVYVSRIQDILEGVLKHYVQLANLEKGTLKEAVAEYLGEYRATPHASRLGSHTPSYFMKEISGLDWIWQGGRQGYLRVTLTRNQSNSVTRWKEQANVKEYTDSKKGARELLFKPGHFVRVTLPGSQKKDELRYSKLRRSFVRPYKTRSYSATTKPGMQINSHVGFILQNLQTMPAFLLNIPGTLKAFVGRRTLPWPAGRHYGRTLLVWRPLCQLRIERRQILHNSADPRRTVPMKYLDYHLA